MRLFLRFPLARLLFSTAVLLACAIPGMAQDVCSGDTGSTLRQCLRANYSLTNPRGYGPARDILYGSIDVSASNRLAGMYTGFAVTLDPNADPSSDAFDKGINTEHVLPQSKGAGSEPQRGDMHNLRPTRVNVNSDRASDPFADIPDAQTDTWYAFDRQQAGVPDASAPYAIDAWSEADAGAFEPREAVKGDIARAVFYFAAIHETAVEGEGARGFVQGQLETLQQWHADDPVTQAERDRSSAIASAQGNENPFVLDATLATRAFSDGYAAGGDDGGGPGGDLQTIAEAREAGEDASVTIRGIVTRAKGAFTYLQDASGPTGASGITVRQPSGSFANDVANGTIAEGTELEVTGTISFFSGLTQINEADLATYAIRSQDNPLPAVQSVTLSDLQGSGGEAYEAELVRIANLRIVNATTTTFEAGANYDIEDPTQDLSTSPSDPAIFRTPSEGDTEVTGAPIPTGPFTFTGVVGQFHGFDFAEAPDTGYQLLAIQSETALPVELTAFNVTVSETTASLDWRTASEQNNAGFEVQHKAAGSTAFARAGFVDGNGTTPQAQTYRFEVSGLAPGTHTFRLKQVDFDGTESFSPAQEVTVRTGETLAIQGPNPMRGNQQARLVVQVDAEQPVDVALYNVLGQRVATLFTGTAAPQAPAEATLSTDRLASGVYFVRVVGASVRAAKQVTVVR